VVLFEIEGFSIEEIAAMQEVSISAVKSRLARGRDRLRRHYEKLGFAAEAGARQEERRDRLESRRIVGASRRGPVSEGGMQ
jgi:predicted DNA-binding protein YlxM (UPF0122 family)